MTVLAALFALTPGLAWLLGGLVLMVIEALAPGAFMVWIGLAALGTGVVVYALQPAFAIEVLVFAALCALTVAIGLRLRRARPAARLNTPGAGLVGRIAHVQHFEDREGRVRVGDSDWSARLAAGSSPPGPGAVLDVVGVDGTVLLVRPRAQA